MTIEELDKRHKERFADLQACVQRALRYKLLSNEHNQSVSGCSYSGYVLARMGYCEPYNNWYIVVHDHDDWQVQSWHNTEADAIRVWETYIEPNEDITTEMLEGMYMFQ